MRTLISLVFCSVMATGLHAEGLSLTLCPNGQTVQYYEDTFSSTATPCANGILNFSNFYFQPTLASGALTASQIDLAPTPIGNGQTGVTGFGITGLGGSQISVEPGQDVTYVLDWFFLIDAGPLASGASLGMDPPSGDITVTQYYCLDSNFEGGPTYSGSAPTCTTSLEGSKTPGVQTLSISTTDPADICDPLGDLCNSITFSTPAQDYADVMTVIQLTGGTDGANFGSVTGTSQIIPPAPEPGTLLLIPGGLLVVGFLRKRLLTQ
jgi:hypothetical protein